MPTHTDDSRRWRSPIVTGDVVRELFRVILSAPYGKGLLDAADLLDHKPSSLRQVRDVVYGVRVQYKQRSDKVLSGSDEALRSSVSENISSFQTVLDGLDRMIKQQAAQETALGSFALAFLLPMFQSPHLQAHAHPQPTGNLTLF